MEAEQFDFSVVFPNIAAQLRSVLGNLHLAAAQLAPAIRREGDPALDSTASLLDQSYYRLLRLVNNLTAAGELGQDAPARRAVVAGGEDLVVLDDDRAVFAPQAGRAVEHRVGDVEIIFVLTHALVHDGRASFA